MSSKRGSKPGHWGGQDPVEDGRKAGQNSKTHGMHAVASRGRDAMTPTEIQRMADLRALLATEAGREEVRQELAARVAVIVERGFQWLAVAGDDALADGSGPIKYLATYAALLHRLLDSWPQVGAEDALKAELEHIGRVMERHNDAVA